MDQMQLSWPGVKMKEMNLMSDLQNGSNLWEEPGA